MFFKDLFQSKNYVRPFVCIVPLDSLAKGMQLRDVSDMSKVT